jgi:hypothetical protein
MKAAAAEMAARFDSASPVLSARARELLDCTECDLVTDVLKPWCLDVASVTIPCKPEAHNMFFAEAVFRASAYPHDPDLKNAAAAAVRDLSSDMGQSGPLAVQAFVALTTSVPALLANSCVLLAKHRDQWQRFRETPEVASSLVEECLRLAGLPTILFREADGTVQLAIGIANRDPAVFRDPERFDIGRTHNPHLTFGKGAHACVGAQLVRRAARVFLTCFVSAVRGFQLKSPPQWQGVAMRYVEHLPVYLEA